MEDAGVRPALTPEEWEESRGSGSVDRVGISVLGGTLFVTDCDDSTKCWVDSESLHALAALCLHGQPFGFTQGDVEALDAAAGYLANDEDADPFTHQEAGRIESIRDRIAALLPPKP